MSSPTGRLKRLFPKHRVSWEAFENGVYAVYQKSRHQSKKVRAFVEFVGGLFKQKVEVSASRSDASAQHARRRDSRARPRDGRPRGSRGLLRVRAPAVPFQPT